MWNAEAQMNALRNGLSNQLKDSLTHADIPDNIVDFVKMCSKRDAQICAKNAETKSGQWEGRYNNLTTRATPHPPQKQLPQEQWLVVMVPLPWTSRQIKKKRLHPRKRTGEGKEDFVWAVVIAGISRQTARGS